LTDATLETFARSLLGESLAKYWTPAEFAAYKSAVLTNIMNEFWSLLLPIAQDYEEKDRTAATNTVDLPATCFKLSRFEVAATGQKVKFIEDDELWKYHQTEDENHCIFKGGKIMLLYTPGSTETKYYRIWFLPKLTTFEADDPATDIPEPLHPLIGVDIAMMAKIKDDQLKAHLMSMRNLFASNAKLALCVPQAQDFGGIRDFSGDEEYD